MHCLISVLSESYNGASLGKACCNCSREHSSDGLSQSPQALVFPVHSFCGLTWDSTKLFESFHKDDGLILFFRGFVHLALLSFGPRAVLSLILGPSLNKFVYVFSLFFGSAFLLFSNK